MATRVPNLESLSWKIGTGDAYDEMGWVISFICLVSSCAEIPICILYMYERTRQQMINLTHTNNNHNMFAPRTTIPEKHHFIKDITVDKTAL